MITERTGCDQNTVLWGASNAAKAWNDRKDYGQSLFLQERPLSGFTRHGEVMRLLSLYNSLPEGKGNRIGGRHLVFDLRSDKPPELARIADHGLVVMVEVDRGVPSTSPCFFFFLER